MCALLKLSIDHHRHHDRRRRRSIDREEEEASATDNSNDVLWRLGFYERQVGSTNQLLCLVRRSECGLSQSPFVVAKREKRKNGYCFWWL